MDLWLALCWSFLHEPTDDSLRSRAAFVSLLCLKDVDISKAALRFSMSGQTSWYIDDERRVKRKQDDTDRVLGLDAMKHDNF